MKALTNEGKTRLSQWRRCVKTGKINRERKDDDDDDGIS